jgi:hypothetical protein
MANKRLEKALSKLTENEKKLLSDHFIHEAIGDIHVDLQDEGYKFVNYPSFLRSTPRDFVRIALLTERLPK